MTELASLGRILVTHVLFSETLEQVLTQIPWSLVFGPAPPGKRGPVSFLRWYWRISGESPLADSQSTVGRPSTDSRLTACRPTIGRQSADRLTDCRPTVDRQSVDGRPIGRQPTDRGLKYTWATNSTKPWTKTSINRAIARRKMWYIKWTFNRSVIPKLTCNRRLLFCSWLLFQRTMHNNEAPRQLRRAFRQTNFTKTKASE